MVQIQNFAPGDIKKRGSKRDLIKIIARAETNFVAEENFQKLEINQEKDIQFLAFSLKKHFLFANLEAVEL